MSSQTSSRATAAERERAEIMLRARDILPTPQRVEIARILFARPQHLSADQLLGLVRRAGMRVSKATVYNTLGLFVGKGLAREVIVDPSKVFYDSNTRPHHHVYDVTTCALTDVEEDEVGIERLPPLPEGTVVEGVDVIVRVRRRSG